MEHTVNEPTNEKVKVIMGAMKIAKVKPDLLIHDDACHFFVFFFLMFFFNFLMLGWWGTFAALRSQWFIK